MGSVRHPRGRLPRRVYWMRRSVVLGVALVLVFGIGKLLGGTGSDPGLDDRGEHQLGPAAGARAVDQHGPGRARRRCRKRQGEDGAPAAERRVPRQRGERAAVGVACLGAPSGRDPAGAAGPAAGVHLQGLAGEPGREDHQRRRPDLVEPGLPRGDPDVRRGRAQQRADPRQRDLERTSFRHRLPARDRLGAGGLLPRVRRRARLDADRRAVRDHPGSHRRSSPGPRSRSPSPSASESAKPKPRAKPSPSAGVSGKQSKCGGDNSASSC